MRDPFKIIQPTALALSGGRTSAYMLWRVLQANGRWPVGNDFESVFANTGREAEATLEFVREISLRWSVPIRWVEYRPDGEGFAEVSFETASRNGEPFEALIRKKKYLPNPVARFCTAELKVIPTEKLLQSRGWTEWDNMVGFRADEPLRVAKIRLKPVLPESPGVERCVPLATAGTTKAEVRDFWAAQPFDLQLPIDFDGTTVDGNCDGCFLKPPFQRISAMQRNPAMPVWWASMESLTDARFTKDGHSYAEMAKFAANQQNLFDPNQQAIDCLCGETA